MEVSQGVNIEEISFMPSLLKDHFDILIGKYTIFEAALKNCNTAKKKINFYDSIKSLSPAKVYYQNNPGSQYFWF